MATEVLMPQMGESIAEGTITKWLALVGDAVERDEPLLEISTDKVDAEIPAPASGVLLEIRHHDGETVAVNEVVGLIGETGEATSGEEDVPLASPRRDTVEEIDIPLDDESEADEAAPAAAPAGGMTLEQRVRRFSSPLVRSIAKREGVDLRRVEGTGVHGRVTKKDILAFLERREAGEAPAPAAPPPASVAAAPAPASAARPTGGFSVPAYVAGENVRIEPMSKIRQITAAHMAYSKATSAHVTTVFHVDFSKVARLRQRAKAAFQRDAGTKLTYMPFIFKAVCKGIRKYPQLNASIDGDNIVYKNDVNLGMAVALDRGLIVPVIPRADDLSLKGLARAANDLADRARSKKLKPEEVTGGTFTITNPGVFGSLFGTPVINQPQVAILGIGTIEKRPVVITSADGDDMIAIRTMSYLAITFDHRLIDGADADHFMAAIKKTIETDDWDELAPFL